MKALIFLVREIIRIYRNPREIHRVLSVIPLSAFSSYSVYVYNLIPPDYALSVAETSTLYLALFIYTSSWMKILFSNEITFDLLGRFLIIGGWSVLGAMILIGNDVFGSASFFFLSFAFFGLSVLLTWALFGLGYKDFKAKYITPKLIKLSKAYDLIIEKDEKKDKANIIHDSRFDDHG